MTLDILSFALGVIFSVCIAGAWHFGQQRAIRLARRIVRHRGNLDQVFFEDAERDATIERPKPVPAATADLREFNQRESQK